MIKHCVICGKGFTPKPHLQARQICCCKECATVQNKRKRKEHYEKNKKNRKKKTAQERAEFNEKRKETYREWRKKNPCRCEMCGEPMQKMNGNEHIRTHDECVLNKCIEYLRNGKKIPTYMYQRAYGRGYTMEEIREMAGIADD